MAAAYPFSRLSAMLSVRVASSSASVAAIALLAACTPEASSKASEAKVAEAAAQMVRKARTLGPGDLQMVSEDRTVAIEVAGDSVHVFMVNSQISVPVTYIENVKYTDNRLRFDIKGIGMKVFEVGDGTDGAVFTQGDALKFVATVISRQNAMENRQ